MFWTSFRRTFHSATECTLARSSRLRANSFSSHSVLFGFRERLKVSACSRSAKLYGLGCFVPCLVCSVARNCTAWDVLCAKCSRLLSIAVESPQRCGGLCVFCRATSFVGRSSAGSVACLSFPLRVGQPVLRLCTGAFRLRGVCPTSSVAGSCQQKNQNKCRSRTC